ncbi:LuxR C-terminal-related transcriptional regulator [Streptomyces sp. NPDC021622]|uniref:helix-turn-helix transcriptional regulator n=1 Tax=Streptomyces sp. NPDC021622 TaxID=3155013 RepID=UPI0033DF9E2D
MCRRTARHAMLSREQISSVRVAALRRELRALGCDRFTVESAVSLSASWIADVLADIAYSLHDPPLADALTEEASALLASSRPVRPPAKKRAARLPGPPAAVFGAPEPAVRLTEREAVVLRRLQGEQSLREIGADLYVSVNTVKSHVRSIYRKFDVTSRGDAVSRARGLRLL